MATNKKTEKAPKNRARDAGEVVPVGVDVSARHKEGIALAAVRERRTRRVVVEQALEAYFVATGVWPPSK